MSSIKRGRDPVMGRFLWKGTKRALFYWLLV